MKAGRALLALTLLTFAAVWPAEAQVATVGPTCTASWLAPTTGIDGLPLGSPVTGYNVYVDKGIVTPGVTVPTAQVTTLSWACGNLAAGAHTISVSAKNVAGEGPATANFPFVLVLAVPPGSPSSLTVR